MPTLFGLFGFILLVIETLIGMVGNGFIAIINYIDWFSSRKLSPADMILSCLGLFRFAFHAIGIQTAILLLFFIDTFQMRNIYIACSASWAFVNTANLWFAAWLSVLYCVKIANFSHPLFLQMKRRFPGMVPWLLLGTVVFSAITTTIKTIMFFPCIIFFSSSILLLTSLWRHKNHLRNSVRDVRTEVHLNAIKALASFSILYVSSFFVEILATFFTWNGMQAIEMNFLLLHVVAAYSSGHAIILIFINPKLKQESVKMLHQLKC
ncbi:taste receptor type 2 member 1-like [Zootoca vivipara]|uniref:taste receptor type 2 member 1-like n=1 Tax=Zootoca vivipara TaxID=8524 RepID=UPI00293BFD3C|nr:taste receptor type 2 member 1-like [Zootoca vivipara]